MRKIFIYIILLISYNLWSQPLPLTPWKERGPIIFPINVSGQINGIGRTCQLKFHKTDTAIIYAITSSGGLYKTTNGGNLWTNLKGSTYLPKGSQASVCIDYANDNIIYLGTGDANYYSSGTGVWKSFDGGQNFVQKNTGMGNRLVIEILQNPLDRGQLIAATNSGIYKSTDSANSWTLKTASGIRFTDMEYKPGSNGRIIYAVTLDSGYYRSSDYGETWTNLMNTGGLSIPSGGSSNGMRIAVCPADTNIVYLGMVKNYGTIFKSNNGGTNFIAMKNASMPNLTGYSNTAGDAGQGNYNFDINCDPINPSILYLVAHNVWKSTDSGVNWTQKTNWWAVVHTDMHHISFSPHNPNKHFNANDGGIWLTQDATATWNQKSDGLAANEISPAASSNIDYDCISTGTQDNGELFRDDTNTWKTNRGGDWYEKMNYDWVNPRTVYYITGNRRVVTGSQVSLNFPFSGNASLIEFNKLAKNSSIIAKNDSIWLSKNIQDPTPTWTLVGTFAGNTVKNIAWSTQDTNKLYIINSNSKVYKTDDLYATTPTFTMYTTPSSTNTAASIAIISKKDTVIYISCGNIIYRSSNSGATWSNIKYNFPNVNIIKLYHDPYTVNESIYAVGSIATYFKMDTMTSWQNLTQSLPTNAGIVSVIPFNEGSAKSEMRVAYYGKGVWSIPIETKRVPSAKFGSNLTKLCSIGKTISFYDSSSNNPTSWTWSFPGGTPSSSTQQNPVITYNVAGIYPVTLTATNTIGSNSETKLAYISVLKGDTLPIIENFETVSLPTNWSIYDDGNDGRKWTIYDTASGFGVGTKCYRFNNTAYMSTSKKDAIITSVLNLLNYDSVWVSFDRAFAISYWSQWYADSKDTLQIAVDNSCGTGAYTSVWLKGHTNLATGPTQADGAQFKPTSTQWKKDTINLSLFAGQKEVSLLFRIFKTLSGGYGQNIYIDNINIWGKPIVIKDTIIYASICEGLNYTFGTKSYTTTGIYKDTIRKVNTGADSIRRTLNLTVKSKTFGTLNKNICQGQSYLFNGINQATSGIYLDTLLNSVGCDSILTLNLNVINVISTSFNQSICQGQSYLYNGIQQTTSGSYKDTLLGSGGCDSIVTLMLTVKSTSQKNLTQSICQGQSYLFNGVNRTTSGVYLDTLTNALGCDSFITLNLSVSSTIQNTLNQSICQGQSYLFNGVNLSTSGIYKDTFISSGGCDSILTLQLTVLNPIQTSMNKSICQGQSYLFNGVNLSTSGTYKDTFISSGGCDSIVTLSLVITSINPTIIGSNILCDSNILGLSLTYNTYLWSNNSSAKQIMVKNSGNYSCTVTDVNGCQGVGSINIQDGRFSSLPIITTTKNKICANETLVITATAGHKNYTWSNGVVSNSNTISITNSGTYMVTIENNLGCKSSAQITILAAPTNTVSLLVSSSYCKIDTIVKITAKSSIPCLSVLTSFNGQSISSFKPINYNLGKYIVRYTCIDTNQCETITTKEISIINCPNSSIISAKENGIKIYPNPAKEVCYIEFTEIGNYRVNVSNILGQKVYTELSQGREKISINLSKWSRGIYLVEILDKEDVLIKNVRMSIE